jgi:hypothetical protein
MNGAGSFTMRVTMSNPEGPHPEYFAELCALAASGQISEPEFVELQDHMRDCGRCRSAHADFIDLLHSKLPLVASERIGSSRLMGFLFERSSYRERFMARARQQGLAVSKPLGIGFWPIGYPQVAALAMALLLVAVGLLGYAVRRSNARNAILAADLAAMSERFSQRDRPQRIPVPLEAAPTPPVVSPAALPAVNNNAELDKAREAYAAAEARSKALQEQLQAAASELESFRVKQEQAIDSRNQLEKKLVDAELTLTRAGDELQKIRQERAENAATIAAQAREIQQLSAKLSDQTETLERETTLLAASRDIHDLMGARNLHIVDVLDVDSKGKDRRAFGRVFYTEEKSLIFYAFDLGDRATTRRNASFQVWGARGPAQNPAQNLGIFYVDDQKQNRWVLKFNDPRILAEIDSVFVTVEPQGGSTRPTGRKFLYAYLKANPNHP